MTEQLYYIHWRRIFTGQTGRGVVKFTREQAEEVIRLINQSSKGLIQHWMEPVEEG